MTRSPGAGLTAGQFIGLPVSQEFRTHAVVTLGPLAAVFFLACGAFLAIAAPFGLTAPQALDAGLVIATIGLWATGVLAESLTALLFFTLAMLLHAAAPNVVFAGFASSSLWLIFSGLVLGTAAVKSGLAGRMAEAMASFAGATYGKAMEGVVLLGLALSFIMPSAMGRVALLLPVLAAFAERLGLSRGDRGHAGLVLGGLFATYLPSSAILPANIPNNVLAGIAETSFQHPLAFGSYFLLHFPVLGALKCLLLFGVLAAMFHQRLQSAPQVRSATPLSSAERRLGLLLMAALALWTTDSLHHVSPAWIGMAAAIVCLVPRFGILPPKALRGINLEPLFFVAAVVGIGAMVDKSGLGRMVADASLRHLGLATDQPSTSFLTMCALSTATGLLTTLPGVPAVLTPLTGQFATAGGLSPEAVLAAQVVGFSTVLLPYQAPPLVMALQTASLSRRTMTAICLWTAALSVLVLWPLDLLWLRLLGTL